MEKRQELDKGQTVDYAQKERDGQVFISPEDAFLFAQGTHYEIYKKLGAHPSKEDGREGVFFAVWAPNAQAVSVVGSFNDWNTESHPMERQGEGGLWSVFVPGVELGSLYKFLIRSIDGRLLYKADPFANQAQYRPETASVVTDLRGFPWKDAKWEKAKYAADPYGKPLSIYECHIGSFMRHPGQERFYTYREFADAIVAYLEKMPYTHVELMGIAEYPYDGSWGYQVTGYYAPTSRYGSPQDFMYLVDRLHQAGIGVILDWVPAHFARDAHGLAEFDGSCIFEHPDPRLGEHPDWGTKIFHYGKNEVKNFLIANALFWMREFHIDGIRVDAVASMLYLDYGKKDGEWVANCYGGNKNLEAIEFFRHLNSVLRGSCPGFLTIAEESTAWPAVTGPIGDANAEGLGFTFKWNMGWMHDFCEYMKQDPIYRRGCHHMLTFAMSYNASEQYILPISHDEVVHLKCSLVQKMPGYMEDKYANLRAAYAYIFGHSGKKLLFMGQDFGQEREWSEERELDWFLLEREANRGMQAYVGELLRLYRSYPCLYQLDNSFDGFEWMLADDGDHSVYAFVRKGLPGEKGLLFVMNFTPMMWQNYQVPVPCKGNYQLLISSDEERFGGRDNDMPKRIKAKEGMCFHKNHSLTLDIPPYGACVYAFSWPKEEEAAPKKSPSGVKKSTN